MERDLDDVVAEDKRLEMSGLSLELQLGLTNAVITWNNRKQQPPRFCVRGAMSNEGWGWLPAELLTATQFDVEHWKLGSPEEQEQAQGYFSYELKPKKNGFA